MKPTLTATEKVNLLRDDEPRLLPYCEQLLTLVASDDVRRDLALTVARTTVELVVNAVLDGRRSALHDVRNEAPRWKAQLFQSGQAMGQKLTEELQRFSDRLESLTRRVEEALRILAHGRPGVPEFLTPDLSWALDLLMEAPAPRLERPRPTELSAAHPTLGA